MFDAKILFSIIAAIIGIFAFFPYIRDVVKKKTKPHLYTWLIWSITQTIAVVGIITGGGGWGVSSLLVGTLFVVAVFLMSIKYGTKDITRSDTVSLVLALLAIVVWLQLKQPVIAVLLAASIDLVGYIPSFRKSFKDPFSETISFWLLCSLSNFFAISALGEYNLLTMTYQVAITFANVLFVIFLMYIRHSTKKTK